MRRSNVASPTDFCWPSWSSSLLVEITHLGPSLTPTCRLHLNLRLASAVDEIPTVSLVPVLVRADDPKRLTNQPLGEDAPIPVLDEVSGGPSPIALDIKTGVPDLLR